jgi:ethanolaminephosphotransferase
MVFVSETGRSNLINGKKDGRYVFAVRNNSISEYYVFEPFWRYVTEYLIPMWIAPNLITLIGYLFMLTAFLMIIIFPNQPLAMILCGVFMFVYHTLDGCDGKQARRTGNSSQLGEIFDHGVDALSCTHLAHIFTFIGGNNPPNYPFFAIFLAVLWISFYNAHWEHYHRGEFFLGYLSACDGQVFVTAICILTGIMGDSSAWKIPFKLFGFNISFADLFILAIFVPLVLTILRGNLVVLSIEAKKGFKNFVCAIITQIPVFVSSIIFYLWTEIDPNLWQQNYLWMLTLGTFLFGTLLTTLVCDDINYLFFKESL